MCLEKDEFDSFFSYSEAKFLTMYEPWIRRIYLPSYANTGCYLYGVIAGYLYHRTKNYKMQLERFWVRIRCSQMIVERSTNLSFLALSIDQRIRNTGTGRRDGVFLPLVRDRRPKT